MNKDIWDKVEMTFVVDKRNENLANPTALLLSSVSMLRHLELHDKADRIQDAILKTIAEGKYRTGDLGGKQEKNAIFPSKSREIRSNKGRKEKKRTCLTDSAISGPIPSPGKRVARIKLDSEAAEVKVRPKYLIDGATELPPPSRNLLAI
ncbi:putative isocitrate dehydrogenase [NAD] subunit alpha, mitochondrial [Capsicum baccatum]|uniref:Isocitrate dehydrogenase [NAD] subunit alpha, mitochondrial n=1 Tax=Capsicum baccatum TaxID=33114 RepID=A0A2G2XGG5_CAPBA|nr:putative isocitrate dehydrogenase [NAD] subunit alpha, mitochondrial [Capsicum baccatum]